MGGTTFSLVPLVLWKTEILHASWPGHGLDPRYTKIILILFQSVILILLFTTLSTEECPICYEPLKSRKKKIIMWFLWIKLITKKILLFFEWLVFSPWLFQAFLTSLQNTPPTLFSCYAGNIRWHLKPKIEDWKM